jgi:Fe-S cluster biosynthesis and repair protein YggX
LMGVLRELREPCSPKEIWKKWVKRGETIVLNEEEQDVQNPQKDGNPTQ